MQCSVYAQAHVYNGTLLMRAYGSVQLGFFPKIFKRWIRYEKERLQLYLYPPGSVKN